MSRFQITFQREEPLKYVGHLDLVRAWERIFRRAGLALSFTQGFHPHPKMAFAAPLPVGVLGLAELLEVTLDGDLLAGPLHQAAAAQLPPGLSIVSVDPLAGPSLPSRLRRADYRAHLDSSVSYEAVAARVRAVLASTALPRLRQREKDTRAYDLRPLVLALAVHPGDPGPVLHMTLRANSSGAGRPDEVLAAMDLSSAVHRIERTSLTVEGL